MKERDSVKISIVAILCALTIALGIAESMLPAPYGIPGIKLGLGNVAVLLSLYVLGAKVSFFVLFAKIGIGAIFSGSALSFAYSAGGGLASFLVMLLLSKALKNDFVWIVSVFGSIIHIVTQVVIASVVMSSHSILLLLTVYIPTSVLAGVFTGVCAAAVLRKIKKNYHKIEKKT